MTNFWRDRDDEGVRGSGERGESGHRGRQPSLDSTDHALLDFTSDNGIADLKNAGTVVLKDRAWVRFDHTADVQLDMNNGGYLQQDEITIGANPLLQIEAGCKITSKNRAEVKIAHGSVELTELNGTDNNPLASQPDVVIQGSSNSDFPNALYLDTNTKIRLAQGRTVPIKLLLHGQLFWAGDIELYADHTRYANDQVEASERILVEKTTLPDETVITPKLSVAWFNQNQGQPVDVPYTGLWTLVVSKFTNAPGANPQFDAIKGNPDIDAPPFIGTMGTSTGVNTTRTKIEMSPT